MPFINYYYQHEINVQLAPKIIHIHHEVIVRT